MKRLLYISILFMAVACKREPLTTYHVKDNIYFVNEVGTGNFVDTLDYTFAYSDASIKEAIVNLPLGIAGIPAVSSRQYKIVVDPASTALAGTHFELSEQVFHSGRARDTLSIKLRRTSELISGTKKLILQLQPNDDFNTELLYRTVPGSIIDTVSMVRFTITISDILNSGPAWDATYARFFGTFSLKKVRLIHELLGMPLDFWSPATIAGARTSQAIYYAATMGRYLNDQAAKGNVILDENGSPMRMAAAYQ